MFNVKIQLDFIHIFLTQIAKNLVRLDLQQILHNLVCIKIDLILKQDCAWLYIVICRSNHVNK